MIVVDTNVMVHLLAGEGARADGAASLLRRDPDWAAPPILLSELRNVLVGSVRRKLVERADAIAMLDDAALILQDRVVAVASAEVVRTALELELSGYDAEFVVLARALSVPLLTADEQILTAAPDVARPLG